MSKSSRSGSFWRSCRRDVPVIGTPGHAERLGRYVGAPMLATDAPLPALSDRELQVFRLIGHGRRTRQIADTLHLNISTSSRS